MSTDRTNAREAEPRWQKAWDEAGIFATKNPPSRQDGATADERPPAGRSLGEGPKYDVLEMFPTPSGRIHMGQLSNNV